MKKEEISLLVQGAKLKDPDCEKALIKGFYPLIRNQIYKYVYDKNYYEDYLIEAEIILINAVKTYDETLGVPFSAYLKRQLFYYFSQVAKNYQPFVSLNAVLPNGHSCLFDTLSDDTVNIEAQLEHQALIHELSQFLPQLRPRQQWLIKEHYFKNKTFAQMAKEKHVTSNSLVKLHRRTLNDLRHHFSSYFSN